MHSHSHGSGFVLLQVLLWSDYPGVWEQRPVSLPELLDVTLVVHDLQYRDTTGQKAHDTGRKFCMLQKWTLALNLVNRQNIFHSWRLLKLLSAWATVRNLFLVWKLPKISRWIPQRQFWLFNCESFSSLWCSSEGSETGTLCECASYVVVDEEANPRFWVVQSGQALQELLHEGSCMFDENSDVDQRHLFVLNTQTHVEFKHWQENFFSSLCPPLRVVQAPHWRRAGRRRKSRSRFHRSTPWGRSYRGSSAAAAETSRCAELLNIFVVFDNQIFNDRQEQFQVWEDQRVFISFKQQHSGLL